MSHHSSLIQRAHDALIPYRLCLGQVDPNENYFFVLLKSGQTSIDLKVQISTNYEQTQSLKITLCKSVFRTQLIVCKCDAIARSKAAGYSHGERYFNTLHDFITEVNRLDALVRCGAFVTDK